MGVSFLEIARKTGVDIFERDGVFCWEGPHAGSRKPRGPLVEKRIGILVASEFSDFQAYYLTEYLSEFGGLVEFLLVDWVAWKFSRPNVKTKGVTGMWDMSVDPIPTMGTKRYSWKSLKEASVEDYDALVILGGHSADIMMTEEDVVKFLRKAFEKGVYLCGIQDGALPLISSGLIHGKRATGSRVVSFMLEKIAKFESSPVVVDGTLVTVRDTVDTPQFVRTLCSLFDRDFVDEREGILKGKRVVIIAGEDFEDVELVVPVMEFLYRGAIVTLATFKAPVRSRPPLLGLEVVVGNFGVSVPLQEIPLGYYNLVSLDQIVPEQVDLVMIPGAFCPWNCVVAETPLEFLKKVYKAGKILAAICHGPIALAAASLVEGKCCTGWLASREPVTIMGGRYSYDWSAVVDERIVTGRVPDDLPEFMDAMSLALLS